MIDSVLFAYSLQSVRISEAEGEAWFVERFDGRSVITKAKRYTR